MKTAYIEYRKILFTLQNFSSCRHLADVSSDTFIKKKKRTNEEADRNRKGKSAGS